MAFSWRSARQRALSECLTHILLPTVIMAATQCLTHILLLNADHSVTPTNPFTVYLSFIQLCFWKQSIAFWHYLMPWAAKGDSDSEVMFPPDVCDSSVKVPTRVCLRAVAEIIPFPWWVFQGINSCWMSNPLVHRSLLRRSVRSLCQGSLRVCRHILLKT